MSVALASHEQWLSWLHKQLPRPQLPPSAPLVFDLFAGCGGLALPFEACGFRTIGYEMKPAAVETYRNNLDGDCLEQFLKIGMPEGEAEVVIGGPPCQPFSQFGYQRGMWDDRDGFPIFIDAIRRIRPKIAIMENVRGLMFRNKGYLRRVILEVSKLGYQVDARILKAIEYGIPQKRERLVIVASIIGWDWPENAVDEPVTAGMALGGLASQADEHSKYLTAGQDKYIAKYEKASHCINPRDLYLDRPARTVTCRNLGGATADMLRIKLPSGKRRRLTIREGARLQGFPDWFEFSGCEYDQYEQIGNAVPPLLGLALARQVQAALNHPRTSNGKTTTMNMELTGLDSISQKVEEALNILRHVGIPVRDLTKRRKERAAKALCAVAQVKPDMEWQEAPSIYAGTASPLTTRDIIKYWNEHYGETIADASYDDVRRKDLVYLVEAGLVARSAADPTADVNDGTRGYAIPKEALALIHSYGTREWEDQLCLFRQNAGQLKDRLSKAREHKMFPVTLPNGKVYRLEPGPHNEIQAGIIRDFLPRFSKGAQVLYLGDTSRKILHMDEGKMQDLGIEKMSRKMLPDIIAYEAERNWLFFIEAVYSSNPISDLRHMQLKELASTAKAECLFVSAFLDRKTFGRFSKQIGWETEVWIADNPDHLIHFDGGKLLMPHYNPQDGD